MKKFLISRLTPILLGVLFGFLILAVLAFADNDLIYPDYEAGSWILDNIYYGTYETVCKGYYYVDYSNKNKIKLVGYGDLSDKYTYETDVDILSTSTPLF